MDMSDREMDEYLLKSSVGICQHELQLGSQAAWHVSASVHSSTHSLIELKPVAIEGGDDDHNEAVRLMITRSRPTSCVGVFAYADKVKVWKEIRRCSSWEPSEAIISRCISRDLDQVNEEECDSASEEGLDLQKLMAPLDRSQLEMLLATLVSQSSSSYDLLLATVNRPVDASQVREHVDEIVGGEAFENVDDVDNVVQAVVEFAARATAFADAGSFRNALMLLTTITEELTSIKRDQLIIVRKDVDESTLSPMWIALEQAWQSTFTSAVLENEAWPRAERKQVFQKLAKWRQMLRDIAGPVFSDPLRFLKGQLSSKKRTHDKAAAAGEHDLAEGSSIKKKKVVKQ